MTKKTKKAKAPVVKTTATSDLIAFFTRLGAFIAWAILIIILIKIGVWMYTPAKDKPVVPVVAEYDVGTNVICENKLWVVIWTTDKRIIVWYWTGKDYIGNACEEVKQLDCNRDWYTWCTINI